MASERIKAMSAMEKLVEFYPPATIDEDIEIVAGVVDGLEKHYCMTLNADLKPKIIEQEQILVALKELKDKYIGLNMYSSIVT